MILNIISKRIHNTILMITGNSNLFVVGAAIVGFWHTWTSIAPFQAITASAISNMNTQIATTAEEQSTIAEEIGRKITAISQAAEQSAERVD